MSKKAVLAALYVKGHFDAPSLNLENWIYSDTGTKSQVVAQKARRQDGYCPERFSWPWNSEWNPNCRDLHGGKWNLRKPSWRLGGALRCPIRSTLWSYDDPSKGWPVLFPLSGMRGKYDRSKFNWYLNDCVAPRFFVSKKANGWRNVLKVRYRALEEKTSSASMWLWNTKS